MLKRNFAPAWSPDGPVTIGIEAYADAGNSSAGTNRFGHDPAVGARPYDLDTRALGLVTGECYRINLAVDGTKVTTAFAVFRPTG